MLHSHPCPECYRMMPCTLDCTPVWMSAPAELSYPHHVCEECTAVHVIDPGVRLDASTLRWCAERLARLTQAGLERLVDEIDYCSPSTLDWIGACLGTSLSSPGEVMVDWPERDVTASVSADGAIAFGPDREVVVCKTPSELRARLDALGCKTCGGEGTMAPYVVPGDNEPTIDDCPECTSPRNVTGNAWSIADDDGDEIVVYTANDGVAIGTQRQKSERGFAVVLDGKKLDRLIVELIRRRDALGARS